MVDYAIVYLEGVATHPPPLVGEFYQKGHSCHFLGCIPPLFLDRIVAKFNHDSLLPPPPPFKIS